MDRVLTVKEVADIFKVDDRTVRRWVTEGKLKRIENIGAVRIASSEVERIISTGENVVNNRRGK